VQSVRQGGECSGQIRVGAHPSSSPLIAAGDRLREQGEHDGDRQHGKVDWGLLTEAADTALRIWSAN
jgi:hypothetical protein